MRFALAGFTIYETSEISLHGSGELRNWSTKNRSCLREGWTCDISAKEAPKNGRYESIGSSRQAKYATTHIAPHASILRKR